MNNEELIKAIRENEECNNCAIWKHGECDERKMSLATADALEAAGKRIARLEDDLRNSTISNPERFKIYGYTVKDVILFADMCKRNDVREADLKQAAWNLELAIRAVMNERQEIVKNMVDGMITMRYIPDFEKAFEEMMPNCGARMKGENDGES